MEAIGNADGARTLRDGVRGDRVIANHLCGCCWVAEYENWIMEVCGKCVQFEGRLGRAGDTGLEGLWRGMRCGQEVPYTHVRGCNHLALQSSRFSHDCEV